MTRLRPAFTPPSSNNSGLFAYGQVFDVVSAVTAVGVWWYQPATGDVTDVSAFVYNAAEVELATGAVLAAGITPGAWNLVEFGTPVALTVANGYRFAAEASGETGFDSADQGYPIASGEGALSATSGAYNGGGGFPSSTWTGQHGADLEYTVDSEIPSGVAAFSLGLAVASEGGRDSEGVAALGLGLAVATAGERASEGTAALTLTLTLEATGQVTVPPAAPGSYAGLLEILRMNYQEFTDALTEEQTNPVECPNDGTPLEVGPDGLPFCRFDGWRP